MLKIIKFVKKQVYVSEHTQNNNLSKIMPPNLCGCSVVVCSEGHHLIITGPARPSGDSIAEPRCSTQLRWASDLEYSVLLLVVVTENLTRSNLKEGLYISSWSKNKVYRGQEGMAQGSLLSSEWIRNQRKLKISVQLTCNGSTAYGMVPPPLSIGLSSLVKSH